MSMKAVVGRGIRQAGVALKKHGGVEVRVYHFGFTGLFDCQYCTSAIRACYCTVLYRAVCEEHAMGMSLRVVIPTRDHNIGIYACMHRCYTARIRLLTFSLLYEKLTTP